MTNDDDVTSRDAFDNHLPFFRQIRTYVRYTNSFTDESRRTVPVTSVHKSVSKQNSYFRAIISSIPYLYYVRCFNSVNDYGFRGSEYLVEEPDVQTLTFLCVFSDIPLQRANYPLRELIECVSLQGYQKTLRQINRSGEKLFRRKAR